MFLALPLHFDLLVLVELVVLHWVAERLIRLKLLLNHALQDTVVRELFLELEQPFAHLPFVFRLR